MRGYLIDTNVISEYNRDQLPHPGVVKWLDTPPEATQYVSVLTLAEIEKGILRNLRNEEGKRRRELQRWFDEDLSARFTESMAVSQRVSDDTLTRANRGVDACHISRSKWRREIRPRPHQHRRLSAECRARPGSIRGYVKSSSQQCQRVDIYHKRGGAPFLCTCELLRFSQ